MDSADADWGRVAGLGRWDELGRPIDERFFASLFPDAPAVRAALAAPGRSTDADRIVDSMWSAIDTGQDTRGFSDVLPVVFVLAGTARLLACGPTDAIWLFEEVHRGTLGWNTHPMEEHVRNYRAVVYALRAEYRQARANATEWAGTRRA